MNKTKKYNRIKYVTQQKDGEGLFDIFKSTGKKITSLSTSKFSKEVAKKAAAAGVAKFAVSGAEALGKSSRAYLDQATSTLFYPDSGIGSASRTANTDFVSKAALTNAGGGVNLIVPLNKYSFFAASQNVVYPTGKMELNITLERNENVLYKDVAAAEGRYVVTKMRLWVPKMELNSAGMNKFGAELIEKRTWGYLADRVETSPVSTLQTGTFDISSSIEKPRFVMLYAVDSTKDGDVTKNSFHYDTYDISGGRQVTRAQLELEMVFIIHRLNLIQKMN